MKHMKKIFYAFALLLAVVGALACTSSQSETHNGRKSMNLRGEVKSLRSVAYEPKESSGGIMRGEPLDYAQSDYYYEFNQDGNVTRNEWYVGGTVVSWDEYTYDADGKLEKIVLQSVYYAGDSTTKVEWENDTDYIRRTYGDDGEMMLEEVIKASKDKIERTVKGKDGKPDTKYVTYFEKGHILRMENKSGGNAAKMEYEYNDKGVESSLTTYIDGEVFGRLEFEYLEFDKGNNWKKRVVYETSEDGERMPVEFTQRTIEYF